jgi:hypothetical protein
MRRLNLHAGKVAVGAAENLRSLTYLLKDTFTGADGTLLTEHAPDIGAGAWVGGKYQIIGNKAVQTADGSDWEVYDVGKLNYTLRVKVSLRNATSAQVRGVLVRKVDASYFSVGLQYSAGTFVIQENGTDIRATTNVVIVPGTEYQIVVVVNGSTISATFNDANLISYGAAAETATRTFVGIRSRYVQDTFDDFEVLDTVNP